MYEYELKHVTKKINRLHRMGKLKNKEIYLFGVSDNTRQIIQILRKLGYSPLQVIDNDKEKEGSYCSGLRVLPPESITKNRNKVIFIYSFFWREMWIQMVEHGFAKSQIYVLVIKEYSLGRRLLECWIGKIIYKKLVKKYGDIPFFLCPYTGTGDIYLIGTFWKEYLLRKKLDDYSFFVISNACKKVAALFNIKNVEVLTQKESGYLVQYYLLCPEKVNLKLLNDGWGQINSNPSEWFRGYKGMYFVELFRKFVFDLPDTSMPKHPQFSDVSNELEQLFRKNKLVEKKTVILSPYSNTLADLPYEFWERLTKKLWEKGYVVCTNSSGDNEPAIDGSIPIFFPLNIAPQFVERAGVFIGVRSGLCDVVSGTKAKKIILYDARNRFYNSSAYEYFSLNHMGLCDDAIEIKYSYDTFEEMITEIIGYV